MIQTLYTSPSLLLAVLLAVSIRPRPRAANHPTGYSTGRGGRELAAPKRKSTLTEEDRRDGTVYEAEVEALLGPPDEDEMGGRKDDV